MSMRFLTDIDGEKIDKSLAALHEKNDDLKLAISRSLTALNNKVDEFENEVDRDLAALSKKNDNLKLEINEAINVINKKIDEFEPEVDESDINALYAKINNLKMEINESLAALNKKIDEFEPEIDDSDIVGGYYIPVVDSDGVLSWTPSDVEMPSINPTNIRGPRGYAGVSVTHKWNGTELTVSSASGSTTRDLRGPAGKSAYEYAKEGGFTGTEKEFAAKLAALLQ